ncbi:hypothetical protein RUND412_008813 [Rhizina undulata]
MDARNNRDNAVVRGPPQPLGPSSGNHQQPVESPAIRRHHYRSGLLEVPEATRSHRPSFGPPPPGSNIQFLQVAPQNPPAYISQPPVRGNGYLGFSEANRIMAQTVERRIAEAAMRRANSLGGARDILQEMSQNEAGRRDNLGGDGRMPGQPLNEGQKNVNVGSGLDFLGPVIANRTPAEPGVNNAGPAFSNAAPTSNNDGISARNAAMTEILSAQTPRGLEFRTLRTSVGGRAPAPQSIKSRLQSIAELQGAPENGGSFNMNNIQSARLHTSLIIEQAALHSHPESWNRYFTKRIREHIPEDQRPVDVADKIEKMKRALADPECPPFVSKRIYALLEMLDASPDLTPGILEQPLSASVTSEYNEPHMAKLFAKFLTISARVEKEKISKMSTESETRKIFYIVSRIIADLKTRYYDTYSLVLKAERKIWDSMQRNSDDPRRITAECAEYCRQFLELSQRMVGRLGMLLGYFQRGDYVEFLGTTETYRVVVRRMRQLERSWGRYGMWLGKIWETLGNRDWEAVCFFAMIGEVHGGWEGICRFFHGKEIPGLKRGGGDEDGDWDESGSE